MSNPEKETGTRTKWTEIELLPDWGEEYYDVYTARKYGKWVMLKTLKKEFADDPEKQAMIEKEFDVRYNLAHPNIVMINDFEDVPGLGKCIITDDVYGTSLRRLLDEGKFTDHHLDQLRNRLPEAMEYIQQNHIAHHPLRPETIIFTENIENLKLIDVGFDQKRSLSHEDTNNDLENYGRIIKEVLKVTGRDEPELRRIAERCLPGSRRRFRDVQSLRMALGGRSGNHVYIAIIAILVLMVGVLVWLSATSSGPVHP